SQEIVKARVENPGLPTGSLFPTVSNIDAALYRRCAINYPKLPTTINEISLNGSWKSDKNGGDFLLVDETCNHSTGMLTNVQLAIKCGRAVKINPAKK
ncbi:unnamed protein product, partial [Didymodactylos carnosus]